MKSRILILVLMVILLGGICQCAIGQGWVRQNDFFGDELVRFYVDDELVLALDPNSVDNFQPIYAPEYHGFSDIIMKEDAIVFGINDSARMFIDTEAVFGDAWTLKTDNVNVEQLHFRSQRVVVDVGGGLGDFDFEVRANENIFKWQVNSRPWLEGCWDIRKVLFGGDIHHYGQVDFEFHSFYEDVYLVQIDGYNGNITMRGDILLDPENGGNWPGAKVLVKSKIALGQVDGNEAIDSKADGYVNYDATVAHEFDTGDVNINGGTLCFVGSGGGLIEGEISGYNGGITLTSVAAGDWDQIMAFTVNGPSNGVDPNHIDDHIEITKDGRYACRWRWSGHGTAVAHDWEFLASKNNNATMLTNTASKFTNPTTQKDVTVPGGGTILCDVGDTIEVWVRRTSPGNDILLTTETCWLYVVLTGGL